MGSEARQLHIFFFPMMAAGHIIPMVDIAKLFARRGVRASLITTPSNAPAVDASLRRAMESGHPVQTLLVEFPASEAGVAENMAAFDSQDRRMDFIASTAALRGPFERLLGEHRPDAMVTDMFFPWTAEVAEEHGVPRLVFHGTSFFSLCVSDALHRNPPPEGLPHDARFPVPGIPHRIELTKSQVPALRRSKGVMTEVFAKMKESEARSYGVVVNSFYEMEPDYAGHYREVVGRKAWHVGPVSLCNEDAVDKAARGGSTAVDKAACLSWLDSKPPSSVILVCFGSMCLFTAAQLREIALGLEASGHPFIWVVRDGGQGDDTSRWLPEGFEQRTAGKGMVIRGWAPQILILNHEAVGGFVTHCGWNSSLEGITAGVPMATWPLFAEQFYNQRLLVEVLQVGVPVGATHHAPQGEEKALVTAEEVATAVGALVGGGEQAVELRRRAKELKEAGRRAVAEGGSSYEDMGRLMDELRGKQAAPCHGHASS